VKAVVLAAGLGTRLRPFTCATPKPLMPVWGVTMLERIVSLLREHGVDDIAVNCHYLHEQVEEWCAANGCKAVYEPEILGTGGVLNPLRDWLGKDPFFLVNGDIIVEDVPAELFVEKALEGKDVIARALVTEAGPRTIEVEPEFGYVTNWKSDDPGWDGTYTYAGFALLKPSILDYVEPTGFSSIVAAYEKAMMDGRFVKIVRSDDLLWTDAGTVDSYIELNRTFDEKGNETDNAFADFPQVKAALAAAKIGVEKVDFLGARGSERVFFKAKDAIVIAYNDEVRKENARYAGHARYLKSKGVSVPEILADLKDQKVLAMADAGREKRMTLEDYVKVVEELVKFSALASAADLPDLEPAFDASLYKWERELFAEHCLGTRFHREMSEAVEKELVKVAEKLEKEPPALVHRDFQSTNVLWKDGKLSFIDFQGMRLGPAAYDLASLVYDPYIAHDLNTLRAGTIKEGERRALIALYAKKAGRPEIVEVLPFAAVQRLVQCLGAFGRLASVGQPQFGKFVMPALVNLLDAADRAGLEALGSLAEELIAAETKAHEHHHECHCGHHHDHECHCGHHHE